MNFHVARSIRRECMWREDSERREGQRRKERERVKERITLSIHEKMRAKATFESISFESTHSAIPPPFFHVNHLPFLDRKTPSKSYDSPLAAQSCIYGQAHVYTHLRTYLHVHKNIYIYTRIYIRWHTHTRTQFQIHMMFRTIEQYDLYYRV